MTTTSSRTSFPTILAYVTLATCLGILICMFDQGHFAKAQPSQSTAQDPNNDERPGPANKYFFSEETPSGDWLAQADFDVSQTNDARVPVVIAGIRSYAGKGYWAKQLMIESSLLSSHTSKTISAVKFGWVIITEQALKERKNLDAALLQGSTQLFELDLPGFAKRRLPLRLEVVKLAKPLLTTGALSGTFFLRIRVSEIRFADGSIWTENELA